eukprot:TRINITY_DN393_c0_g1_i1.p1 TRINITY_DN393_c0_g1~~TRINITY_DN393_c0_g1_i1.p1  ORF type:complete len:314 (-),score=73.82 TRINITY_DN393_c0_g1_i1:103-972(-)
METENTNVVDPIGKGRRMRRIRKLCGFLLFVCLVRLAIVSYYWNPAHFIVGMILAILGLIAVRTKNRCCLVTFGIVSVIQSFLGTFVITYITINFGMQFWNVILFMGVSMLIGLSGFAAFRIRRKVDDYEKIHGTFPTCCNKRQCNQNQQNELQNVVENTQGQSINTTPNDYVMIPIQEQQQPQQTIMFNNQQIPLVYAIHPQQNMIPQPQQTLQQPQQTHQFIQQPQFIQPSTHQFIQQQSLQQPQQQQMQFISVPFPQQQPTQMIPQMPMPINQSPQLNNTNFVYRI